MVDTVIFTKSITSEEAEEICARLEGEEWVDRKTGELKVSTMLNGIMSVRIRGLKLTITGSLSQYYLESYESLSWNQIHLAIGKLEKRLGIGLREAVIRRLDIEGTFYLTNPIGLYFDYLGEYGRYIRFNIDKSSLYYNTKSRQICFYDKYEKIKSSRQWKIEEAGENLVRFETRFFRGYIRQLKKNWGIDQFTVEHLLDQQYQKWILELWYNEYQSLYKLPQFYFNLGHVSGWGDLKEELLKHAINSLGGINEVVRMLVRGRHTNPNMDSKTLSRLKHYVRETGGKKLDLFENQPLDELNRSIDEVYSNNLDCLRSIKALGIEHAKFV